MGLGFLRNGGNMAKIEKEAQKFIKSYQNGKGLFWKTIIPDGRGGQIRKQGFLTKSDVTDYTVKKYTGILSQEKGVKNITTSILFKDYSLQWLEFKKRNGLSAATMMRYTDYIEHNLNPYFGDFKLHELEKFHLRNYICDLQIEGKSSCLLKQSVSIFKTIIKQAEIDDLISHKGISIIPTPKHKNAEPLFWDHSQIVYFLNAIKGSPHHDLWKVTLYTGMRAGEIAGLKWDCVHLNKTYGGYSGAIEVKRSYNQKTRKMQETTKNGDRRIIPILPDVREVLLRLKENSDGEFVFGGKENLDSSHFSRQLKAELANLPTLPFISFHKLRHSFCSYLDFTGVNRRIVSQIMGHRDMNTTNRYSHVNDQMLGNEMSRWLENQNQQKTNNLRSVNF